MKKIYFSTLALFLGLTSLNAQVLFSEDFDQIPGPTAGGPGTYVFAPGFLLRNVDNRTPAANVSYVNEAWERREDFQNNVLDSVAFSTSWYVPAGASNDWMWTPVIGPLSANTQLTWNAKNYDPLYLEGYEVRVMVAPTTPTGGAGAIGNQITNSTVIYSTTAAASVWTAHTIPLSAYAGQSVYIGFRNTSTDKFILVVDDIKVETILNNELQLVNVDTLTEYTMIPGSQASPIVLGGTIKNAGVSAQTNVTLTAKVFDESNTEVHSASSTPLASLAPNATSHVSIPSWTPPNNAQNYVVKLYVDAAEVEQLTTNDTITKTIAITEATYARDNGTVTGSLGIGAGNGGYLGQDFLIVNDGRVSSVNIHYSQGYTGEKLAAVIWDMVAGVPNQIIAYTDTLTYPDDSARSYILPIDGGPFVLSPGRYAVTAVEFDSTIAVSQTSEYFTLNRTWVDWPTSPLAGWANNEDFGASFSKSYVIRPEILPICPVSIIASSSFEDAACGASDGTAEITVGTGTFTYNWSNGASTSSVTGLPEGAYSVTVTNTDLQCSQVVNFNISNISGPTLTSITGSAVDCFGDEGTVTVVITGGTAPYTYVWTNGGGSTATITAGEGTYSVAIVDDNGCVLNAGPVSITAPAELTASSTSTPESCSTCNDGTATVTAAGGTSPYTYSWSPSGGSAASASGLDGGSYTVTVTDANDCETTSTVVVSSSSTASIAENNANDGINAYPNPSNGTFYVTSDIQYSGEATVEILDITGKVLYSKPVVLNNTLSNTAVQLDYNAAGTYMLRFTAGKQTFFRKLVIR